MADSVAKSRNRIIGVYLLYVAGLIALTGVGLGLLAYALHPMHYAGAGPSDPAEPIRELRRSLIFCGAIVGTGLLVAITGIRLITKNKSDTPA